MDTLVARVALQDVILDNCIDANHILFQTWQDSPMAKTTNIIREIQISLGFMLHARNQIANARAAVANDEYNDTVARLLAVYTGQIGRIQALSLTRISYPRHSSVPKATFLTALLRFQLNWRTIYDMFHPPKTTPAQ